MLGYIKQGARSTMLALSKQDKCFRERFARISFWLFAFLPVSLYASNQVCGGYITPSFVPHDSPCLVYLELFDDDALDLIGVTDETRLNYVQKHLRIVARSTRTDIQKCTKDELELFEGLDNTIVYRRLILYERPVYAKEGFCKVHSTWLINLDESWRYSEKRDHAVSVSLPVSGKDACEDLVLEDFVNLQADIPDQAVAAILGQSEAILRNVAEQIGRDSTELCIRSLGVGAPEPSSRQYVLGIRPTAHEVFIRFGPDLVSEVTLVRKKGR